MGISTAVGKANVGVGDLYSAAAVWLDAAITVSNQGVAGVSVGNVIWRPPATIGVRSGTSVFVGESDVEVAGVEVLVEEGVPLAKTTAEVAEEAVFVLVGSPGRGVCVSVSVFVTVLVGEDVEEAVGEKAGFAVEVPVAVPVGVRVFVAVGEETGLDVLVAVNVNVGVRVGEAVAVDVGVNVRVGVLVGVRLGTCVGTVVGLFVLVGFLVGFARALFSVVEESESACTGIANRQTKIKPKRMRNPVLYFITG